MCVCVWVYLLLFRWPRQVTRKLEDLEEGEWIQGKVRNVERCVTAKLT